MDNAANEQPGVKYRVRHVRTIITAVTVSFVIVPQFLNGISSNGVTYGVTHAWHFDDEPSHVRSWNLVPSTTQLAYMVVGILACVLFAYLFERLRRKTCLYLVCICQITTSILLICTNSNWVLHFSRASSAISDVGAGMFCVIYISEIAPDEIRGGLVGIHKLLYGFTEFIPVAIYLSGIPLKYLPFSCVSLVISVLVALCTYIGVPESPVYFLRREDTAGAEGSLKFLHKNETNVSQMLSNKNNILKTTRCDFQTTTSIFQECIKRRTLSFTCVAIALYFLRITAGFWLKGYGMEAILWGVPKFKLAVSLFYLLIENISILFCNLLVIALCDRVGRKKLLLVSAFLSSISSVVNGIILIFDQYYLEDTTIWDRLRIVYIPFNVIHTISFNLGLCILPEVLVSDIFPPKTLNTHVAILSAFNLCAEYVVHYEINGPWKNPVAQFWVLWIFGILSFIVTSFIAKFLSETKRRPPGFMFIETEERVLYSSLQDEID